MLGDECALQQQICILSQNIVYLDIESIKCADTCSGAIIKSIEFPYLLFKLV